MPSRKPFNWRQWLYRRADNYPLNLKLFLQGFGLFFGGIALVALAELVMQPGLLQEVIALGGLIIAVIGAIMAILGYLALSLLRLWCQVVRKNDKNDDHESPTT